MALKIGIVILGGTFKQKGFILEKGDGRQIYQFDPKTVGGNIDIDSHARQYPARLTGQIVKFEFDENNIVTSLSTLVFSNSIHDKCALGAVTAAANDCACGNTKNSVYQLCKICAIKNDLCERCGQAL